MPLGVSSDIDLCAGGARWQEPCYWSHAFVILIKEQPPSTWRWHDNRGRTTVPRCRAEVRSPSTAQPLQWEGMKVITGRLVKRFLGNRYFLRRLSNKAQQEATAPGFCCLLWLVNIHGVERLTAEAQLKEQRREWKEAIMGVDLFPFWKMDLCPKSSSFHFVRDIWC